MKTNKPELKVLIGGVAGKMKEGQTVIKETSQTSCVIENVSASILKADGKNNLICYTSSIFINHFIDW